ncbi:MAG TPA: integration host factor subunit alpha [Desulfobacterales bacterium]|jgi:integration host factor subunit alpha|nr:integration host factor subunit alpha [Desulfobacterales bacterium]
MTLRKAQIVDRIREETGMTRNESFETVESLLDFIKRTLESGEDVLISGFGKFCVRQKRERNGRNPATGDKLIIAPRKVVRFQYSRKLREKINGK